jgi:hypothetical protein
MAAKRQPSIAFLASVFLVAAVAQPLGKGVISGTVVDGESGDPIRKAIVTLTLDGAPSRWATARTDSSGRFEFQGLPAGKYHLRAAKANEGSAIYGANSLRELGDSIVLGEGETRGGATLRFLHSATIEGHVYDSDGDPVANATVNLLRLGRNLGNPILTNYRGSSTDDKGEYRVSNVDSGKYYLRVAPQTGRMGGMPSGHQSVLVGQYYGGAKEYKDATPVHVGSGETLAGLDFHVPSETAVEVRGQVAGVPSDSEPSTPIMMDEQMNGPQITLTPAEAGLERWSTGTRAQGPEHRFQMPDVPAGRYRVEASFQSGGKTYGASQIVDVEPGSGEMLLTLAPATDIQGTLRVEGEPAQEAGNGFRVQLSRSGTQQGAIFAHVGADGRFSLKDVPPGGDWQLAVTPVPPGFLKSAQFGDKDVRFTNFEVASKTDVALNIVVSMHTARVEGEIDAESSDSKRAGIVLAPVGPYHNLARYYYGGVSDEEGKFKLRGIAPGKYKIFALEKMAAAGFRNPDAADQLDDVGEVIELAEGATVQTHPKLIPAARALKALK